MPNSRTPKISVITSTIGRPELKDCIESVINQTIRCTHYVFANGPRWHDGTREIVKDYPSVNAFYLPEDTGDYGVGPSMADVFAAGSYLTRADWILFLDDDNFFDKNHVESLLNLINKYQLGWAYSLRRFVDKEGVAICDDSWDSLGHWTEISGQPEDSCIVDNSCFMVHRSLAIRNAAAWTALPLVADRCFFIALKDMNVASGCTGLSTVNYRVGGFIKGSRESFLEVSEKTKKNNNNYFPWKNPTVFRGNKPYLARRA